MQGLASACRALIHHVLLAHAGRYGWYPQPCTGSYAYICEVPFTALRCPSSPPPAIALILPASLCKCNQVTLRHDCVWRHMVLMRSDARTFCIAATRSPLQPLALFADRLAARVGHHSLPRGGDELLFRAEHSQDLAGRCFTLLLKLQERDARQLEHSGGAACH